MAIRLSIVNTSGPTEVAGRNIPVGAFPLIEEVWPGDTPADTGEAFLAWVEQMARAYVAEKAPQSLDVSAVKAAVEALAAAKEAKREQVLSDWPAE